MENKLPDGINFDRPRDGAPEFVKGRMGLNIARLLAWIESNNLHDDWLNFDLLQSKDGTKLYFKLNDWKATATPKAPVRPKTPLEQHMEAENDAPIAKVEIEYPDEEIDPDKIPF